MGIDLIAAQAAAKLRRHHESLLSPVVMVTRDAHQRSEHTIVEAVEHRTQDLRTAVVRSIANAEDRARQAAQLLSDWVTYKAPVRMVGYGSGRAALAVPAHRLAALGACVYLQEGPVPLPGPLRGGSLIAVCIDDDGCRQVALEVEVARRSNRELQIVGLSASESEAFAEYCDVFMPLVLPAAGGAASLPQVVVGILDVLIAHAVGLATGAAPR